MQATATLRAERCGSGRSIAKVSGRPPFAPRLTGPAQVHLVNAAAGPLAGDDLTLDISVEDGACLTVAATGASLALPSAQPEAAHSLVTTRVRVGAGATLIFLGEPLIASAGSRHEARTDISLAKDARLVWRELLVAGRSNEPPGDLETRLTVLRDGPVLVQDMAFGAGAPAWQGPAVLDGARCVGSLILAGFDRPWGQRVALTAGGALMALAAEECSYASVCSDAATARLVLRQAADVAVTDRAVQERITALW